MIALITVLLCCVLCIIALMLCIGIIMFSWHLIRLGLKKFLGVTIHIDRDDDDDNYSDYYS